jgi:hypothetical protein
MIAKMTDDELNIEKTKEVTISVIKSILREIRSGDFDHGLSVAQMLLSEGPNFDPELLMIIVECVVELSAQAGSIDAKEYLEEKWPVLRNNHLKRLSKNKRTE